MKTQNSQRGFIALISTVIISAMLLIMITEVGAASFYARFDALGSENKRVALSLAESCINVALLALATTTDPVAYAPHNQVVEVGRDSRGISLHCTIMDTQHSPSDVVIRVLASYNSSYENSEVRATLPPNIQIISWQDIH